MVKGTSPPDDATLFSGSGCRPDRVLRDTGTLVVEGGGVAEVGPESALTDDTSSTRTRHDLETRE